MSYDDRRLTTVIGNIYAMGTVGSVAGALTAAFYLIPWVGLPLLVRLFAGLLILLALGLLSGRRARLAGEAAGGRSLLATAPFDCAQSIS